MRILFAEDDLATNRLLEASLHSWGYDVISCDNGQSAWELLLEEDGPRIALLDWMMPGLQGDEVCRKLAGRPDGPFVYTILVTSRRDTEDVIEGLQAGAHDYIVKPFDRQELKSRIEVGVRIVEYEEELRNKSEQLRKYADEMETLAEERAQQLIHADRLATLGTMSAGIAHEINNPVTALAGNMDLLEMMWPKFNATLSEYIKQGLGDEQLEMFLEEMPGVLEGMDMGVKRVTRIAKGLSAYARRGAVGREMCQVNDCITEAVDLCRSALKGRFTIEQHLEEDLPAVNADIQELEQVLVNLCTNAGHAMEAQGRGTLTIRSGLNDETVYIMVEDTGSGILEEHLDAVFRPFFTTKSASEGTGLGLAICKKIIADIQGTLRVENRAEGGARFIIELPVAVQDRSEAEEVAS